MGNYSNITPYFLFSFLTDETFSISLTFLYVLETQNCLFCLTFALILSFVQKSKEEKILFPLFPLSEPNKQDLSKLVIIFLHLTNIKSKII